MSLYCIHFTTQLCSLLVLLCFFHAQLSLKQEKSKIKTTFLKKNTLLSLIKDVLLKSASEEAISPTVCPLLITLLLPPQPNVAAITIAVMANTSGTILVIRVRFSHTLMEMQIHTHSW